MNGFYKKVTPFAHVKKERNICQFFKVLTRLYILGIQIETNFLSILELWFLQVVLIFIHHTSHNNH